jgi:hypothetical protein
VWFSPFLLPPYCLRIKERNESADILLKSLSVSEEKKKMNKGIHCASDYLFFMNPLTKFGDKITTLQGAIDYITF